MTVRCFSTAVAFSVCLIAGVAYASTDQQGVLEALDAFPHAKRVSHSSDTVVDYEIGLGAMRKVRGSWSFKDSERRSGELIRYTWQIVDGFSSNEVLQNLEDGLLNARLLFSCEGRSCGQGVQWANRVFSERVLYGRDEQQRYRVYGAEDSAQGDFRLIFFSSLRSADRQYLHAELLTISQ